MEEMKEKKISKRKRKQVTKSKNQA